MKKKALLAMLLALTVLLSGCALVAKDAAVDAATEIISLGDKVVTKGQFVQQFNNQMNQLAYYYSLYGMSFDSTSATIIENVKNDLVEEYKKTFVTDNKIVEMGLDTLTDEEQATLDSKVAEEITYYTDAVKSSFFADTELTGEELDNKIKAKMEELGITTEVITAEQKATILSEKLRNEIIKDVAVTEDEIKAEFDSKVETDKGTYEANVNSFVTAMNRGTTYYYAPEGVRLVKQILIKYTDEDQAKIDDLNSRISAAEALAASQATEAAEAAEAGAEAPETVQGENVDELKAELATVKAAALANLDAAADDIIAQLEAGADWDTLMAEKTQDPGMQSGITSERGYAVCEGMTSFDSAFVTAAMALEKIGDVSAKIVGDAYGYYIIRYVGDVTPGAIELDTVKDSLSSSLLTTKQNALYNSTVEQWVSEASFKVDLNALND